MTARHSYVVLFTVVAACSSRAPSPNGASTRAPQPSAAVAARIESIASAEWRRDATGVDAAVLDDPNVEVRRAAARALARIDDPRRESDLVRLLSDEDPSVGAFAAYGLGYSCKGHELTRETALVARAASIAEGGAPMVMAAIARALGHCASDNAEGVLVAWLSGRGDRAAEAALALGDLAMRRTLHDATWSALIDAAAGSAQGSPLPEALVPLGRREAAVGAADKERPDAQRTRDAAIAQLARPGPYRIFAARVLGLTGAASEPELSAVLTGTSTFTPAERAEAARALGHLGRVGQKALGRALGAISPNTSPFALAGLVSDSFGPIEAALSAMVAPASPDAVAPLRTLAALPLPQNDAPASLIRRLITLRCEASSVLADSNVDDASLVACDTDPAGLTGSRARLRVLARRPVQGQARHDLLLTYVRSPHAALRAAAFELIGTHREISDAPAVLADGLVHPHLGTVAAAASALALRADLVGRTNPNAGRALARIEPALLAALKRSLAPDALEVVEALLKAAGALHVLSARPAIEKACRSTFPTLRAAAQDALVRLGDPSPVCDAVPGAAPPSDELRQPGVHTVVLSTDAGDLTLQVDPLLAPGAAARLLLLARTGFFDAMPVHRVVPGFVVQLGDKEGDGTGGCARVPLRCETSPLPFTSLSLGVALAGRDTGSSQFFVTLARTPHLDGAYALIGSARGDWAAVAEGDRIHSTRVIE